MKTSLSTLLIAGALVLRGIAYADHDEDCQNVHGKVTVVSEGTIAVNDKPYTVGKSTRITKGDKPIKLKDVKAGDIVCVDARGQGDIGNGEIAGLVVLNPSKAPPKREVIKEKEIIKEAVHDEKCGHAHGRVTRVTDHAILLSGDGKTFVCGESTRISKGGKTVTVRTLKPGDFVCLETKASDIEGSDPELASVVVLAPADATAIEQREIIKEKVTEKIQEKK
jgi:hypothetical protein